MKIHPRLKIEQCLPGDEDIRPTIQHPFLDVPGKQLIATNGRFLVAVPVEVAEGETSGMIPREAFALAREGVVLSPVYISTDKDKVYVRGGWTIPRPTEEFPDWKKVAPKDGEKSFKIHLDPSYLLRIAEGLGSTQGVCLTINPDEELGPIKVTPASIAPEPSAYGWLMPRRP